MGFCFGIRRAVGRASTFRVQSLRSAWTRLLAVSGSAALAEHRTTGLSAVVVATVLLSWTPLLSLETVAEVPFELYQHHLIVTKGSIGPLNGLKPADRQRHHSKHGRPPNRPQAARAG